MATPQPNDLQLCRYCYGTIVSLPGTCSNCHHFWSRDERGTLRCRFGEQANPIASQQSQAVDPVIQQQLLLQAQSRIDMSLHVPSAIPQGQQSATPSPNAFLNQPRPGPPTARAFAAKPQLPIRNMKPPQTMAKPPPSPFHTSAMASSANLRSPGLPTPRGPAATFNMPAIKRQEGPAPRSQAKPGAKAVPIIKIETYATTADSVPEKNCDASEKVQLDQGISSPVITQTPKNEQLGTSFRQYGRAELLNVYADINRELFMTSSLSEEFWRQTQSLGILHPNSYFFRDLHAKLRGPLLD